MVSVGLTGVACVLGLVVLDRLVAWGLPWLAPLLPNEFCGPDGWLMDTQNASGIFDRTAK